MAYRLGSTFDLKWNFFQGIQQILQIFDTLFVHLESFWFQLCEIMSSGISVMSLRLYAIRPSLKIVWNFFNKLWYFSAADELNHAMIACTMASRHSTNLSMLYYCRSKSSSLRFCSDCSFDRIRSRYRFIE